YKIRDAAVGLEELIRHLEHGEEKPALRARPGFVPAARRPPDELAGLAFAFRADEAALEHPGLLDLDVLVVWQMGARRHAHQRGKEPAVFVYEQRFLLDARIARLLPRHVLDIQKAGRHLG